jgi:hypothetical protein
MGSFRWIRRADGVSRSAGSYALKDSRGRRVAYVYGQATKFEGVEPVQMTWRMRAT